MKIRISLPENRDFAGRLEVLDASGAVVFGPVPAAGRAHDELAATHGNASRSPLRPYGNTPLGIYAVRGVVDPSEGTGPDGEALGTEGAVLLEPTSGQAALADAHGRFRLFIQGGDDDAGLRATAGGVRLRDRDLKQLVVLVRRAPGRMQCEIVTTAEQGEKVSSARTPLDHDPPALPGRSYISTRPSAMSLSLSLVSTAGARATGYAPRMFVVTELSGSSGGTVYGGGGGDIAAGTGADTGASGPNDTGVGPFPIGGGDVAPTPGTGLYPLPDQTGVTIAQAGGSQLLSTAPPTGLSNPYEPESGWLPGAQGSNPYSPNITDTADPLVPYVGGSVAIYTGMPPDPGQNAFMGSPAVYSFTGDRNPDPFGGSRRTIDTSGYLAMNGDGIVAPPLASDNGYANTAFAAVGAQGAPSSGGPPFDHWVDPYQLAGAPRVGTATIGGNTYAQYQVTLGGVTYNAYANDSLYPNQAFLVPISQADPTADQGDFGSVFSPPGNSFGGGRSTGPVTPGSPVQNRTPPAGLPPVGAGSLANALAQLASPGFKFVASPTSQTFPIPAVELPSFNVAVRASGYPVAATGFPVPDHILVDPNPLELGFNATNPNSTGTAGEHALGLLRSTVSETYQGVNYEYVEGSSRYISATTNIEWAAFDPKFPFQGEKYLLNLDTLGPGNRVVSNPEIIASVGEYVAANPGNLAAVTQAERYIPYQAIEQEVFPTTSVPPDAVSLLNDAKTTLIGETEVPPSPGSVFRNNLATSGAYGAGVGGTLATLTELGQMTLSDKQYSAGDYAGAAERAFAAGSVSGATGAAIETAFTQQVSQQFAQSIVGGVARSALGSGPAAGIFQVGQMLLSDQSYTGQDYAAKGGTAAIEGALSGALSAGLVGAIWGTEVPFFGNAIGFGVGVAAYFVINSEFGHDIEGGLRGLMR